MLTLVAAIRDLLVGDASAVDFQVVDIAFRISAQAPLPTAYPYPLYASLSRHLPWLHDEDGIGVFPLNGDQIGGRVRLGSRAALRLRAPAEALPKLISLTGRRLDLADGLIDIGVPRILPLRSAASLYARMVQIKLADIANGITPEAFLASARKKLKELDIDASPESPLRRQGPRAGEPMRRVLRIKGERHVGFALLIQGLTADESLRVQRHGLGGRRKMGCGLFVPVRGVW